MFAYPPPSHYLLPSERLVWRSRRHWAILAPQIALTYLAVAILAGLMWALSRAGLNGWLIDTILWYGQLGAILRLAVITADWYDDLIMITDERVLNVTGLLASRMTDTPISKITDRKVHHTVLGNILGYGSLVIESAGDESLQKLVFVPQPMTMLEAILKLTSKKELPPSADDNQYGALDTIEEESAKWPDDGE